MSVKNSVSVIIPTFNRGNVINEAIESALKQTVRPLEVIVVDDGSTDDTSVICRKFPIVYLKISHSGSPAKPRNIGISAAKGKLVAFLDSDDRWLPNKLERQLPKFNDAGVGLSYSDVIIRDPKRKGRNKTLRQYPQITDNLVLSLLLENFITTSTVVVRRQTVITEGGFDEHIGRYGFEDYHLWLRLAISGVRFARITEPLVEYCQMHDSLSTMGVYAGRKRELVVLENLPILPREYNSLLRYRRSRLYYELARISPHSLERIQCAIKALGQFSYGQISYRETSRRIRQLFGLSRSSQDGHL